MYWRWALARACRALHRAPRARCGPGLAFVALQPLAGRRGWAWLIGGGALVGWWASTVTARNLGVLDPSNVVVDEVIAFWLVLWLVTPTSLVGQVMAFGLFRFLMP